MNLTHDISNNCFYWLVETETEEIAVSPTFDKEEAAIEWYGLVSREILSEYGVEDESNN